ncbi:MAG: EamA family transporter RarD [Bacillota bacterium]
MGLKQMNEQVLGISSGAGAYLVWGLLPIYWKLLDSVPSLEVLAHRIVWSFGFMVLVLLATRQLIVFRKDFYGIVLLPKKFILIVMAAIIISINWLTYIWAVSNDRIIETSLGYYINPLVSVCFGIIVLKEKLSFWQIVSFCLAAAGVANMAYHFGSVPWVSLILAFSFAVYGLLKKIINLGAITGITLETLIILPVSLIYLVYLHTMGIASFGHGPPEISGLLLGAGVVTAVPLLLFAGGANRLPLSVVGFLQYIAPTIALVIGVYLYHEPFTTVHLSSFIFIWVALTVFSLSKTKLFVELENHFKKIALKAK